MDLFNNDVLVLDKTYTPVYIVSLPIAINYLFLNKAKIFVKNLGFMTFDEWLKDSELILELNPDLPYIKTVNKRLIRPFVIILENSRFEGLKGFRFSRKLLIIRDNNQCQYCGKKLSKKNRTVDHVVPRSRGGKTVWTNVVLCCKKCNMKKGNRLPEEAGMKLLKQPKVPNTISLLINYIQNKPYKKYWEPFLIKPF